MRTDVMTFFLTPVQMCSLTQSRPDFSLPYFSSCHLTNRDTEKPDESTAKSCSTLLRGKLDSVMSASRIGVSSALSSVLKMLLKCGTFAMYPFSCAARRSDMNRRPLNVE